MHVTHIFTGVNMLEKYAKLLRRARSAKLEALTAWYSFFGLKEDPFLSPIPKDEINYFVNREDVVDTIVYDVGVASRGIPIILFLVGPQGSGRTSILWYVKNVLERLREQNPKEFSFKGELYSSISLFEKPESDESVQLWVKVCKKRRDYLFIDDAKPKQISMITREFTRTTFKVFVISPLDLKDVYSMVSVEPETLFLQPLSFEATTEMLEKRVNRVLLDKGKRTSIFDIFEEEALRVIHKYGMGVPDLILRCASWSLKLLRDKYVHEGVLKTGRRIVSGDLATKACKITGCLQAVCEFERMSHAKMNVLERVLDSGKTPTEISAELGRDRTTISRHLNDLRKLGLVEFVAKGRESVYKATRPAKVRFEIERMPNWRWEFASS